MKIKMAEMQKEALQTGYHKKGARPDWVAAVSIKLRWLNT